MRRIWLSPFLVVLWVSLVACSPPVVSLGTSFLGVVIDGSSESAAALAPSAPDAGSTFDSLPGHSATVQGSLSAGGDYRLLDLGPAALGDQWTVSLSGAAATRGFIVVLFDVDNDLLMRARVASGAPLQHIMRADTPDVRLGVMPVAGQSGGTFAYTVSHASGAAVPLPRQQIAYLNFGPAEDVHVQRRAPISFAAFDSAVLDPRFTGQTQAIKDAIVASVRADYAAFDVTILSSDEGPPPTDAPYSTIQFGGSDPTLLGLADSVDMYNGDLEQTAIVYVDSFAPYKTMKLEPDEMGVMIANVAAHELGHLLGLYHTEDSQELMDSVRSAWDLAAPQTFHRGPLEHTVFATGMENTPRLLTQTVGVAQTPPPAASKSLSTAKTLRYKEIRRLIGGEIPCKCGLCIDPDQ